MNGWTVKKFGNGKVNFRKKQKNGDTQQYDMESFLYRFITNSLSLDRLRQHPTQLRSRQHLPTHHLPTHQHSRPFPHLLIPTPHYIG